MALKMSLGMILIMLFSALGIILYGLTGAITEYFNYLDTPDLLVDGAWWCWVLFQYMIISAGTALLILSIIKWRKL